MLIQPVIFPAALFVALSNLEKIWLTCVFFYATIPLAVGKPRSDAGIAQSVEQLIRNQQVVCSSHIASSIKSPVFSMNTGLLLFLPPIQVEEKLTQKLTQRLRVKEGAGQICQALSLSFCYGCVDD